MRYVSMDSMDFEEQIDRLLAGMTRRQKVGQLIQYGSFREYERSLVEKGEIGSLLNFCGSTLVSDIQQSIMHSPNPVSYTHLPQLLPLFSAYRVHYAQF